MEMQRTTFVIYPRRAIFWHEIQDLHLPHDPPYVFFIGEILCVHAEQAFLPGSPIHVLGASCNFGTNAQISGSCGISHNFPDRIDIPSFREQHPFPCRHSRRYRDVEYYLLSASAKRRLLPLIHTLLSIPAKICQDFCSIYRQGSKVLVQRSSSAVRVCNPNPGAAETVDGCRERRESGEEVWQRFGKLASGWVALVRVIEGRAALAIPTREIENCNAIWGKMGSIPIGGRVIFCCAPLQVGFQLFIALLSESYQIHKLNN